MLTDRLVRLRTVVILVRRRGLLSREVVVRVSSGFLMGRL